MKKVFYTGALTVLSLLTVGIILSSYSSGPSLAGDGRTGAPGESTCISCHSTNALNSGSGSFTVEFNGGTNTYSPGQKYTVKVTGTGSGAQRYGFQLVALRVLDGVTQGTFTTSSDTKTKTMNGRDYIEHNAASSSGVWTFEWTAPSNNEGEIKFYLAGNATEAPTSTAGDNIYTSTLSISPEPSSVRDNLSKQVNVYPNPVLDKFSIMYFGGGVLSNVRLLDQKGSLVKTFGKSKFYNYSVEDVKSGVYYLSLEVDGNVVNKKLIKK